MLGRRVLGQIDQIRQRRQCRQLGLEGLDRLLRELAEVQEYFIDPVRRQHARPAAIGDDGQPAAHRAVAGGQALGGREQGHKRAHAHGARTPQGGVEHIIAADDGAAVRLRRLVACRLAPGLEHDHRLGIGGRAQRAHESARTRNAFQVHHDAVGLRIISEEIQHLRNVHGGIGPERHHGGKTHGIVARPVQNGRRERPRLRDQCQRARSGQRTCGTGIELQRRALDAQAIGAEQMNPFALRDLLQIGGQFRSDSTGNHQHGTAGHAPGHFQGRRHIVRRQGNDRQIGTRLRQVGQGAGGMDVQKNQTAGVALRPQGFMDGSGMRRETGFVFLATGKDDDGLGGKKGGEVMLIHGQLQQNPAPPAGPKPRGMAPSSRGRK